MSLDHSRPRVSVVIPAFNYGRFIGSTLECLQAQTLPDWEAIVVDDGSTDDTTQVVESYAGEDARIRLVRQPNSGPGAARNNGIRHSRAPFVQFLDADDLLETRKLERHAARLEAEPDIGIVYGEIRYFSTDQPNERLHAIFGPNLPWMPKLSGQGRAMVEAFLHGNILTSSCVMMRLDVANCVGPWDETLQPIEDWEFFLRCACENARFAHDESPGTTALVRSHPDSISKNRSNLYRSTLRMRRKIQTMSLEADLLALSRRLAWDEEASLGIQEGLAGRYGRGMRHLLRAGMRGRRLKWLLYAPALPLLTWPALRPVIEKIKALMRPKP